ncbi:YvrJ protein family [Peptoniphilus harei]|jgi:conserved domain protein|uniref:YvrJ protein family n=2 Tax=Peptoniphilus harei TaxID=54005 RepID=A0A2X1YKC6_9FIRM|nr:YvrJ family protein [Peptoniphilus harei]MDU1177375.1 YvrJ family protein [Peptoniphilus harei]SPY48031.1 YvrJ protein family [Peptoniphilus harei]VEJ34814.1 YvrJ protein family [Peptoniphilus harei]
MMEDLIANISNIGFPIAISCYLLVRLEKKMEELKEVIVDLSKALEDIGK